MTRVAYVDALGGAAGDMLLAALLDAGAPEGDVRRIVDRVMPRGFAWRTEEVERGGFRGRRLVVDAGPATRVRPMGDLLASVEGAELPPGIADLAGRVLRRLAEAEAAVHGVPTADVRLYELGDDDTLLDVVGVVAALDALAVERVVVSNLPLAFGRTAPGRQGHADIPLPAPVALELLRGFNLRPARAPGEPVTPTAAALLATLAEPGPDLPQLTLEAVGYGAGTRDPEGAPNLVRVLVGSAPRPGSARDRPLVVLEANLDDLSPELVADAVQALLTAGALDAWTTPVVMKKGRPAVIVSALCEPSKVDALRRVFFTQTSTLGVRSTTVMRSELDRRIETVEVSGTAVRVKVAVLDGRVVTAKPEHDDVRALAAERGRPVREVAAEADAAARELLWERAT
jgi:uncharacterized protein (TIGR00299 family) protein